MIIWNSNNNLSENGIILVKHETEFGESNYWVILLCPFIKITLWKLHIKPFTL